MTRFNSLRIATIFVLVGVLTAWMVVQRSVRAKGESALGLEATSPLNLGRTSFRKPRLRLDSVFGASPSRRSFQSLPFGISPSSVTVNAGQTATYNYSVSAPPNGITGYEVLDFSVNGLPSGVTWGWGIGFESGNSSVTPLEIQTPSSIQPGSYSFSVVITYTHSNGGGLLEEGGEGGDGEQTVTFPLTLVIPVSSDHVRVTPASISVDGGQSATFSGVEYEYRFEDPQGGCTWSGYGTYSFAGLPVGASASVQIQQSGIWQRTFSLVVNTTSQGATVAPGTYPFTLIYTPPSGPCGGGNGGEGGDIPGDSGGYQPPNEELHLTLIVNGSQPPQPVFRYLIQAEPQTPIMTQQGSVTYTIGIEALEAQYATSAAYLAVGGLPSGVTASFQSSTVMPGSTTRLTLSNPNGATPGVYSFWLYASNTSIGNPPDALTQRKAVKVIVAGTGTTTLHGRVMTAETVPVPIQGVTLSAVTNPSMQVQSDANGYFTLTGLASVYHQIINVDGHTADTPTVTYPVVPIGVDVVPGIGNEVDFTVYLPKIDTANIVPITQDSDTQQVLTSPAIPNAKIMIPPHTIIVNADGSPVPQISLTPVPPDKLPMPLPDGVTPEQVGSFYSLQPGGAVASNPIEISFPNFVPNSQFVPAGTTVPLWTVDHDLGTFHVYGSGKPSSDGTKIVPDFDPEHPGLKYGLTRFSWHGFSFGSQAGGGAGTPTVGCGGGAPPSGNPPVLSRISLVPANLSLEQGEQQQLRVVGQLSDGSQPELTQFCTFQSSDPSITVSPTGLVRAASTSQVCPSSVITARITSSPPGVACLATLPSPQATSQVRVEKAVQSRFTSPGGVFSDGTTAAAFEGESAALELKAEGVQVKVTDKGTNQVIFNQSVSGTVNVPLTSTLQKVDYELEYGGCNGGDPIRRTRTLYRIPDAEISFTPDPIGRSAPDQDGNTTTTQSVQFSATFNLQQFSPPVSSIEYEILKDGEVIQSLGQCSQGAGCTATLPAGFVVDSTSYYEISLVYRLSIDGTPKIRVARRTLIRRRDLIVTYNDNIEGTTFLDVDGTSCREKAAFTGELGEPARLEIRIFTDHGTPVNMPIVYTALPAGRFTLPLDLELPPAEYHFEMKATAGPREETAVGDLTLRNTVTGNVLPVGHTFVRGVDISDGHLVVGHSDLTVPGRGLSLEISRTYSSSAGSNSPGMFGFNWNSNYEASLELINIGDCSYINLVTGDGQSQTFKKLSNGQYRPQPGYHGTITPEGTSGPPVAWIYRSKEGVKYRFETYAGQTVYRLKEIRDTNNNTLTLSYNAFDQLAYVTDASGRRLKFTYDLANFQGFAVRKIKQIELERVVAGAVESLGVVIQYQFDGKGNLVSAQRENRQWQYGYTDTSGNQSPTPRLLHRLERVTDPNGNTTTYEYYSQTDQFTGEGLQPPGCQVGVNCASFIAAPNRIVAIKRIKDPSFVDSENNTITPQTTFEYDLTSLLNGSSITRVIDPRGYRTVYTMNRAGSATKVEQQKDPGNAQSVITTNITWDQYSIDKTSETDALGRVSTFEHDTLGNMTKECVGCTPGQGETGALAVSRYTYESSFSRLTSKTDAINGQTTYTIDSSNGNLTAVTVSPDQVGTSGRRLYTTSYVYDSSGNLVEKTDPRGFKTFYEYSSAFGGQYGQPTRVRQQVSANAELVTENHYDNRSRLTYTRDPYGLVTNITYDELDRPVLVQTEDTNSNSSASSPTNTKTFAYYPNGEIKKQTDGDYTKVITLDPNNRPSSIQEGIQLNDVFQVGSVVAHIGYDANGNQAKLTDRRGVTRNIDFDPLNRPVKVTIDGPHGGPYKADGVISETTYNDVGSVTSVKDMHGAEIRFEYDGLYRQHYKRFQSVNNPATGQPYFEETIYDAVGNLISTRDRNGKVSTMSYDRLGRTTQVIDPLGRVMDSTFVTDTTSPLLARDVTHGTNHAYTYDGIMRPLTETLSFRDGGDTEQTRQYVTTTSYNDAQHRMSVTDPRGTVHLAQMDGFGRTYYTVNDYGDVGHLNLSTWMHYDNRGNRIKLTDAEGNGDLDVTRTTTFNYDILNRLTSVAYPPVPGPYNATLVNYTESMTYDGEGLRTSMTNARGIVTEFHYDNLGRLLRTNVPGATPDYQVQTTFADAVSLPSGAVATVVAIGSDGRQTKSEMDGLGRVLKVTDGINSAYAGQPLERSRVMTYDGVNLRAEMDFRQNQTQYEYDAINRLKKTIDPLSRQYQVLYDEANLETTSTDPRGIKTVSKMDGLGRLVKLTRIGADDSTTVIPERRVYDENSNVTSTTDAAGNVDVMEYDAINRPIRMTSGANVVAESTIIETVYNRVGQMIRVNNGRLSQSFIHDALGRSLSQIDGVGRIVQRGYDGVGNLVSLVDPYGDARRFAYTHLDELERVERKVAQSGNDGFEPWVRYDYDNGRRRVRDSREDKIVNRQFDDLGRLREESESNPDNVGGPLSIWHYEYDSTDNLTTLTDAKSQIVQYDYDAMNRLTHKGYPGATGRQASDYHYSYSPTDRVTEIGEVLADTTVRMRTHTFDTLDRLASETDVLGKTSSYTYFATGLRATRTDGNSNTTSYVYDAQNRLKSINGGFSSATFQFASDGLLSQVAQGNLTTTYDYDNAARITDVQNKRNTDTLSRYQMAYDDPRNSITLTETIGTASPEQTHYQFGRHNELVEVRYPTYKVEYGYEGPMRARSFERSTDIATGALNYQRTYCYGDLGRLTTMNDSRGKVVTYSYDQNGNQITKSVAENSTTKLTRFAYDIRDRMRKVEEVIDGGNPTTVGEYDYDESGRRIEQTTAEGILRTSYDGDEVLNEWDANSSQTARSSYLHGNGMLLARRDQRPNLTQTYRMTWNHLGSTSETVDEAGQVAAQYRYDAWGQFKTPPTATELESSGGRTLTGQKFDKETGLFAMGNGTRFYDADTGMFNQKDPVYGETDDPQSMSPYAYARNNPVSFTDPTGMQAQGDGNPQDSRSIWERGFDFINSLLGRGPVINEGQPGRPEGVPNSAPGLSGNKASENSVSKKTSRGGHRRKGKSKQPSQAHEGSGDDTTSHSEDVSIETGGAEENSISQKLQSMEESFGTTIKRESEETISGQIRPEEPSESTSTQPGLGGTMSLTGLTETRPLKTIERVSFGEAVTSTLIDAADFGNGVFKGVGASLSYGLLEQYNPSRHDTVLNRVGQAVGSTATALIGTSSFFTGLGGMAASGGIELLSGGSASVVAVPAFAGSAALTVGGGYAAIGGIRNLIILANAPDPQGGFSASENRGGNPESSGKGESSGEPSSQSGQRRGTSQSGGGVGANSSGNSPYYPFSRLIPYGEELSRFCKLYREKRNVGKNINLCVIEYVKDGKIRQRVFENLPGQNIHSEDMAMIWVKSKNINPNDVKRIYSEFHPCTRCDPLVRKFFPNAKVEYSFPYNSTGRGGKYEILKKMK